MSDNPFVGSWTYRSLLNDADVDTDFNALEFGRGTIALSTQRGLNAAPVSREDVARVTVACITRDVRDRLAALGHIIRDLPDFTPAAAGMCAIRRLEPGTLEGGADPRRESYAIGW